MSNFSYLEGKKEYSLFSTACVEAERVFAASPAMAAVGARRALELAVKWVYWADNSIQMPYKDNLQALIHEPSFRFSLDKNTWGKLTFIIKLGNLAVHTEKQVSKADAILSLSALFEFVEWIDYCYGNDYIKRSFDENAIPSEKVIIDEKKIKMQESLLSQKDSEIEALRKEIESLSISYTQKKEEHKENRSFIAENISEFATRKKYIDVDLKLLGWVFKGKGQDCIEEYPIHDMMGIDGQSGFIDYVLMGKDGSPLAVIEAKRTSKDPNVGRQQCKLYADSLEKKFGKRPIMFYTNGFETYFWDDTSSPPRPVSGIFSKKDLEKLMERRDKRKDINKIIIDDKITDRYYQKEAIRAVCHNIQTGHRKSLLVMATGTGKTRTASSLTDVLSRGGYITNILFLADRTALVKQAKEDFRNHLPDMSLCNLLSNKEDKNARVVFSTYQTILNSIDSAKNQKGEKIYTPAHFDLIIIDEAHRSIFKKYRAIFEYFDALIVGLTATPKTDVERNTYDFFEMEEGVPTFAYDYSTAVISDKVLVPFCNIEVKTKFLTEGIKYDELSQSDKERYEEDFSDEEGLIDFIPPPALNKFVFNQNTVDMVLEDLMSKGIKIEGGDKIGKTIIFAQNKRHAQYIIERFDKLYPQYNGNFARRIVCDDNYAQTIIDDFKQAEKMPQIVVSVDMMDTGIDVPEVLNLVFFKTIRSKTKFWQMIGRGTRLCKDLACIDSVDGGYIDKRRFFIFDYCGNFEFFRVNKNGIEGHEVQTLSEAIFSKQLRLIVALQDQRYGDKKHELWRETIVTTVNTQINALNPELVAVRLQQKHIEKFKSKDSFVNISEQDIHDLGNLATLIYNDEIDEYAKRFDNFMYNFMLSLLENTPTFNRYKTELRDYAVLLASKTSIPQIKAKLPVINGIISDDFWTKRDLLDFEFVRKELRELMKFISNDASIKSIYTNLNDPVLSAEKNKETQDSYDFKEYKLKVNRYIELHKDEKAIWKLRNNIKLTDEDFQSLSDIFLKKLGNEEDYKKEYGELPFGLLIRQVAKLEHDAAMKVFSKFINEQGLNQHQIVFIHKIIDYVVQNGYFESASELMKAPFDRPHSFLKLFDQTEQTIIIGLVNQITENALEA